MLIHIKKTPDNKQHSQQLSSEYLKAPSLTVVASAPEEPFAGPVFRVLRAAPLPPRRHLTHRTILDVKRAHNFAQRQLLALASGKVLTEIPRPAQDGGSAGKENLHVGPTGHARRQRVIALVEVEDAGQLTRQAGTAGVRLVKDKHAWCAEMVS